ncbi:MAG: hypothetical protein M0031_01210 [Thermaerobacter sp.]|jgi:hypothetical protein|nr:hypothetical protein [Thermaerobacter sp.]
MPFPFEVPFGAVQADLDAHVDAVFSSLRSDFLTLPKGAGFLEYPVFERGYQALKQATGSFSDLSAPAVLAAVFRVPVALLVLRAMLGFSPPEWAWLTGQLTGKEISQKAARSLDRRIRMQPLEPLSDTNTVLAERMRLLVETACRLLSEGAPPEPDGILHRLDKVDTRNGPASLSSLAQLGVPYAMLLYERFLGRPFAAHRDSVSELVGDVLETCIEDLLTAEGVSFRKTKRAERLAGFDQAPDFVIPDEFAPRAVIEAKLTEDDGTARDKVTRIQHLDHLSREGVGPGERRFEVIACIAGRGFKVRREDMKKLLLATQGKVFTLQNLDRMIECTTLRHFRSRR